MKPISEIIRAHAELLDSQHKTEVPTRVRGTRRYLQKWFKALKRGGPLRVAGHELEIVAAPKAAALDQVELL